MRLLFEVTHFLTPTGSESTGERIQLSYKDKFKKSKKNKGSSSSSSSHEEQDPSSPRTKKRSIRKTIMAKIKYGKTERGHSLEGVDGEDTIPEEVEGSREEESSPSNETDSGEHKPGKKRNPPRPNAIVLKQDPQLLLDNPKVTLAPSKINSPSFIKSPTSTRSLEESGSSERAASHSPKVSTTVDDVPNPPNSPQQLSAKFRTKVFLQAADDDFFVVKYLEMSVSGAWLCVANSGGSLMTFKFHSVGSMQSAPAGVSARCQVLRIITLNSSLPLGPLGMTPPQFIISPSPLPPPLVSGYQL